MEIEQLSNAGTTFDYTLEGHEIQLIDILSQFPDRVEQAANEYRPLVMANYAYDLADAFHSFYHAIPVLQADVSSKRQARLGMVAATRQVLASALSLLDIKTPEVM
jgi:arginyl-tRNA synthetase